MNKEVTETKLRDSSVPSGFAREFETSVQVELPNGPTTGFNLSNEYDNSYSNDSVDVFDTMFLTFANICGNPIIRDCHEKQAIVMQSLVDGTFIAALIIDWDEESQSSEFYFTFDNQEIKGMNEKNIRKFNEINESPFAYTFFNCLMELHRKQIADTSIVHNMCLVAMKSLYAWMDSNATEGEIKQLTIDGVASYRTDLTSEEDFRQNAVDFAYCTVSMENGKKFMKIVFGELLKSIAKGASDALSETNKNE